jgi:hypothetical protein
MAKFLIFDAIALWPVESGDILPSAEDKLRSFLSRFLLL